MLEVARFTTPPEPCSYLPGRTAQNELCLVVEVGGEEYQKLLREGFRRFGMVVFRSACPACRACQPLRVPVEGFRPSRSQRRVLRRNRDVEVEVGPPEVDRERLQLYQAFLRERSRRVGWREREVSEEEYRRAFLENIVPTLELRYRLEGRLAAVAYVDESPGGLNSIYCFHHPDLHRRSLGTFDVLTEIALAREAGLPHVYLGYYVAGSRSMSYKAGFRPAEVLVDGEWRALQ